MQFVVPNTTVDYIYVYICIYLYNALLEFTVLLKKSEIINENFFYIYNYKYDCFKRNKYYYMIF